MDVDKSKPAGEQDGLAPKAADVAPHVTSPTMALHAELTKWLGETKKPSKVDLKSRLQGIGTASATKFNTRTKNEELLQMVHKEMDRMASESTAQQQQQQQQPLTGPSTPSASQRTSVKRGADSEAQEDGRETKIAKLSVEQQPPAANTEDEMMAAFQALSPMKKTLLMARLAPPAPPGQL